LLHHRKALSEPHPTLPRKGGGRFAGISGRTPSFPSRPGRPPGAPPALGRASS
jgi:hypothetical protein